MSVYIPGMAAPSCCGLCPFQASRWTGDFCSAGQFMMPADFDFHEIHEKCPLVPIKTPHGELIERKSAKVRFCQHCHWKESIENACEICVACPIDLIPTIVDAEGGGEDG